MTLASPPAGSHPLPSRSNVSIERDGAEACSEIELGLLTDQAVLDALDAVLYADLFGCAVSEEEALRFARGSVSPRQLSRLLDRGVELGVLVAQQRVVCLAGRERHLLQHTRRQERAAALAQRARRVAKWVQRLPFVRGVALTGSVAAGQADSKADVDLLLVVEGQRMGLLFVLCGAVSRLLGRWLLCPNYYLATNCLALDDRSQFVARELLQARPLSGAAFELAEHNPWARERFPNAGVCERLAIDRSTFGCRLQALCEWPFAGRLGDVMERAAGRLVEKRLRVHYRRHDSEVPEAVKADWHDRRQLRFHGARSVEGLLDRYRAVREEVADRWRNALDADGPAAARGGAAEGSAGVESRRG